MIKKSIIFTLIVLDSYSIHASENVDKQNEKITNNINGSLNVGQKNDASVLFDSVSVNITDYFSIATCGGNSSQCTNKSLKAEANINNSATVGASVTIIGDAAKGDLNINDSSKLYTQQLWVSGNDNDINNNATNDDSNGKLLINNNSKVYVVSSQAQSPFNNDIRWNNTIVNANNNINGSNKAVAGDLVLGKTGNGIIEVKDSSELDVSHDLIVSTGVDGAPNTKASTINIDSKSNITVNGDMLGGVSASGKLSLTMKTASNMNVMGNVSVGIGNKSDISVAMSDKSVMHVGNKFDIATGSNSVATLTIDDSKLSVNGSSSIGSGNDSRTTANLTNGATISGTKDINIAEGDSTHVDMAINNSSLTTDGALSIGSGNNSEVIMAGGRANVTSRGQLLVAKGDGAHATLDYTSSELTTGSAVIANGNNATADVELKQSSFTSNGDMTIGQGTGTTTTLTLNNKSQVNARGAMSVAKG
ncbi:autotransporter outer membrane beta-barrel domain-containing protein, partial [Escherichia marmotae]|nr:autotransporter outer membrane beta-barrel domain-containing protein [Escherichia marmotae]